MFSNRHHIHLICDFSDPVLHLLQDSLFIYFESKVYLTHDLFLMRPESSAYSWQCINACDYTFLLIGDSYGQLANTGVSQLHISYLNARTKQKPMVAFIRKPTSDLPVGKESRQLNDFINLVNLQVKDILFYDDDTDLLNLTQTAYQLVQSQQIKATNELDIIDETLPIYDITDGEPTLIDKNELMGKIATTSEPLNFDNLPSLKNIPTPKTTTSQTLPRLVDMVNLTCSAHAFQGGTLIEVSFKIVSNWLEILTELAHLSSPFGNQLLWKTLNDLATPQAMPIIKADYPKVHAISRCQVIRSDMLSVQSTLLQAEWIEKVEIGKEIWQLTDTAKHLIQQANS